MSISRHTVGKPAAEKRCARRSGNGLPPVVRWGRTEYVRHCHSRGALSSAPFTVFYDGKNRACGTAVAAAGFYFCKQTTPICPGFRPRLGGRLSID